MARLSGFPLAKSLYGLFFVALFPLMLIAWARSTESLVPAPAICAVHIGWTICAVGLGLILNGWIALWFVGGGLPMNIAPPPRFVSSGIYALLPHPIYMGFCILCAGVSIARGSASGLWLVTPCVILGCTTLVLGYERPDLASRFGHAKDRTTGVLPPDSLETPTFQDRIRCYLFLILPWLVLYETVVALGVSPNSISTYLPFEMRLPVIQGTEVIYASTYLWVGLTSFVAPTRKSLRHFCLRGLVAMAIMFPLFFVFPLVAEPRPFAVTTILDGLLHWERSLDSPAAAFPSYHVVWALVALPIYEDWKPTWRWLWRFFTTAIVVSCLTTGMNSLLDVIAGVFVGLVIVRPSRLWQILRQGSEHIANSWREWRIGPVRIINHSIYAALAGFVGVYLAGVSAGADCIPYVFMTALAAIVCAGLWAQTLEGSPRLLRPFGYFGGLLGVVLGVFIAKVLGAQLWLIGAAFCVGAPWAQALGRLRCLVQGCCHGHPTSADIGIRYTHERSRVSQLSELRGVPIHPTPLYSILWNVYVGLALAHLWLIHVPLHFICGMYLILIGLGRFVEEAYRGEPQTLIFGGLRLYQWIAMAMVFSGGLVSAYGRSGLARDPDFSSVIWIPSIAVGLIAGSALGVDFPASNRRFARLT